MKGRKISQTGPLQGRKPHQITHSSMRSLENTNQDGEQRLHPLSRQSSQKVLKMQKLRNTHYSKASIGQFPETLLFMRYQQDHFKTHLQLDPTHPIGQFNPILNLQYWSNIRTILEQFIEKNPQSNHRLPYPFEELNCTNSSEFDDELFEIILNSYLRKQIQKLVISNCRLISLQGLLGICSMENLIALDISGNELVTDQLIETIVSSLMQLQHLNVSGCPEITDTALQSIAYHRHKHLLSFSCENSYKISYVGMNDLIMKCEQLQKINVADCPKVTFIGVVVNVRDNQLQYIGRNVQYLNVNNCHQLQYYSLCWMMTALPMLVEFSAVGVHAIDDNILRSMISGCPMLMKINVNYCRRVTMDIFRYLGQLYKLQFLELHFAKMSSHDPYQSQHGSVTGDNGVRSHHHSPLYHHFHAFLKKAAENLIQLDLSENKFINDDCFQITLPSKQSPPPYLSRSLRFLNLSLCTAVTSLGIVSLIPNYPNLESLNLSGLKYINDSALQIIAYYCKQLKVLSINGCVSLTDLGILAICHHCKALIELNASYDVDMEGNITGEQYSDEILEGIFLAAKKLRKVCLHNQARLKFHNKWLKYFIKYFANYSLQSINLIGCTNIMMDSLQPLLKKCYLLNNLLLPHHLFTNSQIVSKKFWYETFTNTIYTETFNQQDMDEQSLAVRQSLTVVVDVRKARIPPAKLRTAAGMDTNNITSEKKKSLFLHLLKPHSNAPILEYRDQYIQRRLLENFAIRIIQKGWYVHKIWQKFKYNILSRKIARRLYIYHLQRQFEKKVRFFTENHAAKKLQKFIIKYLLQYNRAVRLVIYHYRKWSRRKKLQNYIIQMKKIVLIQARVRGMLVRLSERYILSQIYLKLPKFWKIVANYANDEYQKQMRDKKLPIPPGVMDPNLLKGGKRLGLQRQNTKRKMLEVQQEEKEEEKQILSYLQAYASPEKIRSLHSIPLSKTAINGYEVEELKDGAQEMLQSIRHQMQERITNHQKPFAIPISIMIPQSFDSKPYVSLFDGRKLSYYGNTSSIFNEDFTNKTKNLQHFTEVSKESLDFFQGKGGSKHSSNSPPHSAAGNKRSLSHSNSHKAITTDDISTHLPIHVYQNKFYPLVHPKKRENITSDLVLYNPMVNNFELAKNYQKVLYCQMCSNRLRMILCKTCSRGYCFFCAFQYHNSLIHRNHQMEFMEPRIVHVEKVSQSLIYHIDNASNIMYDLRYVVKYLRSKAELAKITEEKRLLREYERKQEQMRIAILQAQQEYNEKQDSVMLITLLYRSYKAKKIVKEKRIQLQLEKFLLQNKKIFTSIIKFQVLFRRYQIRHWFYSKSFVFRGIPKYYKLIHATTGGNNKNTVSPVKQQTPPSKVLVRVRKTDNRGKLFPFDELRKLVTKCNHRRHIYERTMIIGDIEDKYSQILQLLNANIEFWINYNQSILPKIEKYSKLRDDYYEKLTIKSQQFLLANLSNTQKDKELNDKILREMKLKVDCLQERIDNLKNIVWWIKHHLRFCYRKLALLPLRLQDLLKQLIWIYTENMLLQRVRIHGEKRIAIMTEIVNNALLAREKKREAKEKEEEAAALAAAAKNGGTTTVAITTVVTSTDAAKKQTGAVSAETKNSPVKGPNNNKLSKEKEKELTENDFMTMPKEWLIEKINSIINQLVAIDVSQESILKEEITKLELDYYEIISFDSLLEELIQSLMANNQIIAEKVTLEVKLIHLGYGSEEAIRVNESLVVLKNKQKQLVHGSIDAIKVALQSKYDEQEKKYLMLYSFPGDAPELPIEEMKKISCILLDEFDTRRSHIDSTHFLKVYYLQPWITNDAIEDIRYEERLAAKQLKLGKLREELNGITYRVQENENKKKGMLQQIREVETQIEVAKDIVPDESDFQKEKREKNLIKLEEEKNAFELELRGIEASLNELAIIDVPLQNSIEKLNKDINEISTQLKKRRSNREKSIKFFFDIESTVNEEMKKDILNLLPLLEDKKHIEEEREDVCKSALEVNRSLEEKSSDILQQIEWPSFLIKKPNQLELQTILHQNKSRIYCSPTILACITIEIQLLHIQSHQEIYTSSMDSLEKEYEFIKQFSSLRQQYEYFLTLFLQDLQFTRKQRSLELDLQLRKIRLNELRDLRVKSLQELKIIQLKQDEIDRIQKEEMDKLKNQSRFVALAKQTKKAIRGVNDAIRELRYAQETAMTEEELKIADRIREKNKDGLGARTQCIRALYITVGAKEADFFQRQNDHLKSRGLPFFERMEKSLGNSIYLWYQLTYESNAFITDLKLSHKDPESDYYQDLLKLNHKKKDKYDSITHDEINLLILFRKSSNANAQGIKRIEITFTEQEETRMIVDGFVKLEPNLSAFGLPEVLIWIEMVSKKKKTATTNTDALIAEVKKVRELLTEHPKDKNLHELLKRLNEKLEVAYKKEESNEVTNPLAVAIDLMSINEMDMEQWLKIFEFVDVEKRGRITLDEFYSWIEMPPTDYTKEVFLSVDAIDDAGFIEFGDFMRAIGTYCFFGKEEILRFIYVFIDKDRKGYCFFQQFQQFVDKLNPYDKTRSQRAIKGMILVDKMQANSKLTFADFQVIQKKYPAIFLPAFLLQDNLRKKILGVDWWFQKLSLYSQVRNKILKEGQNTEEVMQVELNRFKEEEDRKERMAKREVEIRNEPSEIRKVILKAKQFIDEVS